MKQSPWLQRSLYFLAGVGLVVGTGVLQLYWLELFQYRAFNDQPAWLLGVRGVVEWLPWLAIVVVVVLRVVKGRQVRVGWYILGSITPIALLLGWLFGAPIVDEWNHLREFDAAEWRNQGTADDELMWPPRLCMVDDLIQSGQLLGKTQGEVSQLLGPPAEKGFPFGANAADIHYYLGPERGFIRIDSEWLLLNFGEDGKLSGQRLYRD